MAAGIDLLGSGDIPYPARVPNLYIAGTYLPANGTTPVTVLTGSPRYYIMELGMQLSPDVTIATAGTMNAFFADSNFGTFFNLVWFVPQNAPVPQLQNILRQTNGPGFYWSSKANATTVTFATDKALTAGFIRYFVRYGLTSVNG